jgi:hypothetical protein
MRDFFVEQGHTRVFGEAYICTPQAETRGERCSAEKEPLMEGNFRFCWLTVLLL